MNHTVLTISPFLSLPPNVLYPVGAAKPGAKLEFLVVCRFAKLSVDEQRVARTASIIGTSFTSDVLHSLLPKQLRPYLPTILHALVACHWLKVSNEQTAQCVLVEYSFAHPLLQQTLYDLTPCSVRTSMHLSIAQVSHGIYILYSTSPSSSHHYTSYLTSHLSLYFITCTP
jgi:hypothetical protein